MGKIMIFVIIALLLVSSMGMIVSFDKEILHNLTSEHGAHVSGMRGTTRIVDVNGGQSYTTIQAAVNAAQAGDTIRVWAGTYIENVQVHKRLSLIGNGSEDTIIDGGGNDNVVTISVDHVNITGFNVTNSGDRWGDDGIEINNVNHCIIRNCIVYDNNCGITLYGKQGACNYNTIENNTCYENSAHGIYSYGYQGACDFNIIDNNTITNEDDGMYLSYSNDNIIKNNVCLYNHYGIRLIHYSNRNTVINNILNENANYGLYIQGCDDIVIGNNTAQKNTHGIVISGCINQRINNNIMNGNGLLIVAQGSLENWNTHTIDNSNEVNGKPLYYWKNATSGTIPYEAGQIILANCTGILVEGQNISNGSVGIIIGMSNENTIKHNIFNSCWYGIYIYNSNNNEVNDSTFHSNRYGLFMDNSIGNNITNSTYRNNTYCAIYIEDSNSNIIKNNDLNLNFYGIYLHNSNGNIINNCSCSLNYWGTYINLDSDSNIINFNTYEYNNQYGLFLDGDGSKTPDQNVFSYNYIHNNTDVGIYVYHGTNNIIHHNDFIENNGGGVQAKDDDTNNGWDNDGLQKGNYWSDYETRYPMASIVDERYWSTPYSLLGTGSPQPKDYYPVVEPINLLPPDNTSSENFPDLTLNSSDISFSNPTPTVGETITINAEVKNVGWFTPVFGSDGNVTSNPSSGDDVANSIAIDSSYIYTAGWENTDDSQWRIEKRDKATGALVTGFKDPPTNPDGVVLSNASEGCIMSIAVDSSYIYVAGYDFILPNDPQWRIEKRDKTRGALVNSFDDDGIVHSNPSGTPYSLAIDSRFIYVAGTNYNSTDSQWQIEKRDITTGALVAEFGGNGNVTSNPTILGSDRLYSMAVDSNYIYVAGYDDNTDGRQGRIEKRDITTGALVAVFGGSGNVTSSPNGVTKSITVDSRYIYIAGSDAIGNGQWLIEKRDITTGTLVTEFGVNGNVTSNPSSDNDVPSSIVVDSNCIYIAGGDYAPGSPDSQWHIEKRDITNGALITSFDGDGIIQSNPSSRNDNPFSIVVGSNYMYIAGTDYAMGDGDRQWRIEKRYKDTGALVNDTIEVTGNITFYDGNPASDGVLISRNNISVVGYSIAQASVNWTATPGTHDIYVCIENVTPGDSNLSNNIAYKTINVSIDEKGPHLKSDIPDTFSFSEDTIATHLINLSYYFEDTNSPSSPLTYSIIQLSGKPNITATIEEHVISFSSEYNWTGNGSFQVNCSNDLGLWTLSNVFIVTVTSTPGNQSIPQVTLVFPLNETVVNTTSINLTWESMNPLEDSIVYHIFLGSGYGSLIEFDTTTNEWYLLNNLEENRTYYWSVVPMAGSLQGKCLSGVWHFLVNSSFEPVYNITVELDFKDLEIVQDQMGMLNLTITNNGNVPVTVTLSVMGALADYVNVVDNINLNTSGSQRILLTIDNTGLLVPGNYEIIVKIEYPTGNRTFTIPIEISSGGPPGDVGSNGSDGFFSGSTVAMMIGAVVILLFVIVIVFVILHKRKKKTGEEEPPVESETVEEIPTSTLPPVSVIPPQTQISPLHPTPPYPPPQMPPTSPLAPGLTPVPPSMGNMIPGYVITHKIASGSFATVYRAQGPQGQVAIKLPKFLDETVGFSVLEQFKAEADMWNKLKHRNIVTFYEGDVRPAPYMVIEYMEGGNLLEMLKGEPMPIDTAMALIKEILSGMAYAHRMASVHRDIKPENILFTSDGTPKITDWGIGKAMYGAAQSKTVGPKGTLAYSAPEQVSEEKYGKIDWSTDVFQLGIVFYEMLTGENPFRTSDPIGTINNIVNTIPIPPSSLRPGVPPAIDTVILRALEKEKNKRFSSADSMLEEMKRVLKG